MSRFGEDRIPLDGEQMLRINFVGPPGTFTPMPFREVLAAARQHRPLPELADATVLIGVTARSQQDYHATPFANNYARYLSTTMPGLMPGTEVHAHILATLHDRAFITTPLWLHSLPWLLLTGVVLGRVFNVLSLGRGLLVIDYIALEGRSKGITLRDIYVMDRDALKICSNIRGGKERPTKFVQDEIAGFDLKVLKREKP